MKNTNYRKPQINHANRTITITETFQRAASEFGTAAFNTMMDIRKSCPGYKVVCASPRKYAKKAVRISYDRMEKYISCLRDGTVYLEVFEKVKKFAKSQPNPYLTVSNWFNSCFPDYGCYPEFDENGYPIVEVNLIPFERYKDEQEASVPQKKSKMEQLSANMQQGQGTIEQSKAS